MKADKSQHNDKKRPQDIEDLLYLHLKNSSLIIPTTAEEVEAVESLMNSQKPASIARLNDPYAVLAHGGKILDRGFSIKRYNSEETEAELARAAREGREIPEEIERLMRRDREKAESGMESRNGHKK